MDNSPVAFYKNLPAAPDLAQVFSSDFFRDLPEDWHVVITDVVGSTRAIEAGRYKDVNMAGGLSAIALANAFADLEFPFIFGGDGVTFLIPGSMMQKAGDVLFSTALKVRELFDLELRVGQVSMRELRKHGKAVRVARMTVSPHYSQAIVQGEGIDEAEALIKTPGSPYLISEQQDKNVQADFTGFTCRWRDIPSDRGETVALIVKIRETEGDARRKLYETLLDLIGNSYGKEKEYHPVKPETLNITDDSGARDREARAISGQKSGFFYRFQRINIAVQSFFVNLAMRYRIPLRWGHYNLKDLKHYNIISCDFKKYDGTLKMVLAGPPRSRELLVAELERLFKAGKIYYGLHRTDRALLTCILHAGSEQEVHFVDGADGGYAMAARTLKAQMKGS